MAGEKIGERNRVLFSAQGLDGLFHNPLVTGLPHNPIFSSLRDHTPSTKVLLAFPNGRVMSNFQRIGLAVDAARVIAYTPEQGVDGEVRSSIKDHLQRRYQFSDREAMLARILDHEVLGPVGLRFKGMFSESIQTDYATPLWENIETILHHLAAATMRNETGLVRPLEDLARLALHHGIFPLGVDGQTAVIFGGVLPKRHLPQDPS